MGLFLFSKAEWTTKRMKSLTRKGQVFENFGALAVGIAGLAIALVVTFLIITKSRDSMSTTEKCAVSGSAWNGSQCCVIGAADCAGVNNTGTSFAFNATGTLANAVQEVPGWVSLIVIAVIGSVILGLVAMFRNR